MSRDKSKSRILIYRLGSMGDTVVSLPCLHLIAKVFPASERVLLTNFPVDRKAASASAIIGESGLIHGYMRYTSGARNALELARLWWRIFRFRADTLVYLMPVRSLASVKRDLMFFRSTGIRSILGVPTQESLTHKFDEDTKRFESEAMRLARTLCSLGEANPENIKNWDLCLTEAETKSARQQLSDLQGTSFIVCGPGTKMQAKDWGTDNWQKLLARLSAALPTHSLVLIGAFEDQLASQAIAHYWSGTCLNLCGKLTPRETAAVIAGSDIFLGPDSGPMHLAAAVGTPAVIAFSARGKPGIWFPVGDQHQVLYQKTDCFGCGLETCIEKQKICLNSITVDAMYQAAIKALEWKRLNLNSDATLAFS